MDGLICAHCGADAIGRDGRCLTCGAEVAPVAPPAPFVVASPPTAPQTPQPANGVAQTATPAPTSQANGAAPSPAPGYPRYPQGYAPYPQGQPAYPQGYAPYPPAPAYGYPAPAWSTTQPGQQQPPAAWPNGAAPAAQGYPYGYPYPVAYGYPGYYYPPYYYPMPWRPRRAPTETLALVVSWIVTILGGVSVLLALALAALTVPALMSQSGDSLAIQADLIAFVLGPLLAGAFAIYFGIRGVLRRPSARFTLANPWWFAALAFVVLAVGIALWHLRSAPGSALATAPLLIASGALPALAILALTSWRLRQPSTRRHVWMSLFYGLTLAPLLAIILEVILSGVIGVLFQRNLSQSLTQPTNPGDPTQVIIFLLTISAVAPLVEEGVKPLGAVLIMRRIRTPASAFLMGVAAGVGFDILETIGYIGMGEADWVDVAVGRIGAGLLHGVGAGMAALGWYYLINGKGVRLRWLRGFGGILYAVLQHAIFNGSNLLGFLPGPVGSWMQKPLYIGRLPLDGGTALFLVYYAIILGVLFYVTGRLGRTSPSQEPRQRPQDPISTAPPNDAVASDNRVDAIGSGVR